jgi:hypothetical protein
MLFETWNTGLIAVQHRNISNYSDAMSERTSKRHATAVHQKVT